MTQPDSSLFHVTRTKASSPTIPEQVLACEHHTSHVERTSFAERPTASTPDERRFRDSKRVFSKFRELGLRASVAKPKADVPEGARACKVQR